MVRRITSVFRFRRKALFMLACILLVVAMAHRPWMLLFAFSAKGLTSTLVLVVGAIVGVTTIHELAQLALRSRGEPWYTRRGSLVFLPVALLCINALFSAADNLVSKTFGMGPFLSSNTAMCILIAVELMWIALLE